MVLIKLRRNIPGFELVDILPEAGRKSGFEVLVEEGEYVHYNPQHSSPTLNKEVRTITLRYGYPQLSRFNRGVDNVHNRIARKEQEPYVPQFSFRTSIFRGNSYTALDFTVFGPNDRLIPNNGGVYCNFIIPQAEKLKGSLWRSMDS